MSGKKRYSKCSKLPPSAWIHASSVFATDTIQYNIRLLEAVRTQRRTMIEREKYVENENVKMVHNE